jgi:hypothetical protein
MIRIQDTEGQDTEAGYGGRIRTGTTIISVRIVILVKQEWWCEDGEDVRGCGCHHARGGGRPALAAG